MNCVTFDPDKGSQIASVSDDHTCRIWDVTDQSQQACFALGAPGVSVRWNQQEPMKVSTCIIKHVLLAVAQSRRLLGALVLLSHMMSDLMNHVILSIIITILSIRLFPFFLFLYMYVCSL